MSSTKLYIFLGAGGVGKTTLSAGFACHLALQGSSTGLLSIDPAKRLKTALQTEGELLESGSKIEHSEMKGELIAAMLVVSESLKRWILESIEDGNVQDEIFEHPLYQAVADRIAGASEALAAVRIAEWMEAYPDTEHLIIDTAPGIHALDFVIKPEKLLAFLDSKIIEWLKWFSHPEKGNWIQKVVRGGTMQVLHSLGKAGGQGVLTGVGELLLMLDQTILKMIDRISYTRQWIASEDTSIYLVTALRDDALAVSNELENRLKTAGLQNFNTVINRTVPDGLIKNEALLQRINTASKQTGNEQAFASWMQSMIKMKEKILAKELCIEIPVLPELERSPGLTDLASAGSYISSALQKKI